VSDDTVIVAGIDANTVGRLERKSLAQQAADKLRELILLERLKPGIVIPEREIAHALGVSRTPLREALRLLAGEGLVEVAPSKPPRVANPTLQELEHLLRIQGALEGLAGELACRAASDEELERIAALEQQMRKLSEQRNTLRFFECDMAFHRAIVEAAHNPPLGDTHAAYHARLWRARFISSRRRVNRKSTLAQHQRIAAALLTRNPRKASQALRQHLRTAVTNISKALHDGPEQQVET
jgi:DNA-binding GntR family transcriptional regulator